MTPSRWQSVKQISADALELPAGERSRHIIDACGNDTELRDEVERLVSASDHVTGILDRPLVFPTTDEPSLPAGTLLAERFRIVFFLGRGGMGEVYRARHEALEEDVALKIIGREIAGRPGMVERFRQEVQRARRITHPNVCRIHDLYSHTDQDGRVLQFLTMQLVEGPTLGEMLKLQGGLPVSQAMSLLKDLLAGLDAAHRAGIAHCDLKPNNVLVEHATGPTPRAIITDFGLARALSPEGGAEATRSRIWGGSPAYMAPELRFGPGGIAGDIYAFGAIAYELFTDVHPFQRKPVWELPPGTAIRPVRELAPDVPQLWEAAILRCLEPDPARRFSSVSEFENTVSGISSESDHGSQSRRGITRRALPYVAAGLIAGTSAILGWRRWLAQPDVIAVLPFENASQDANLDYLSDGITNTLINSLSQVPQLHVLAFGLVRQFRGRAVSPTQAGKSLHAKSILTGHVRRQEGMLNVEAELIDVASGRHIWGDQYSLALTNVLEARELICTGILSGLQIRVGAQQVRTLRRGLTSDEAAFQLYLQGQYLLGLRTEDSLRKSKEMFTQAVARDPKFALAHAGLASSRLLLGYFGIEAPGDCMPAARSAAETALAIEPAVAEAHTALGFVRAVFDWDWHGAEASFRQAIALKEDLAEAHHWFAKFVLNPLARHDESIAEMKLALKWDPSAVIIHTNLGHALYLARRFDEAIAQLQGVIEMNPRFNLPYWTLAHSWAIKGNLAKAVEASETARALQPGAKPDLSLAYCYGVCGKRPEAVALLENVLRRYKRPAFGAVELAYVQGAVGDMPAAFRSLDLSWSDQEPLLVEIGVDPKADSLRSNSAYADLLRKINLNPANYRHAGLSGNTYYA